MNLSSKSKFRNKRTHYAGYSFASKLESELFGFLKILEKAGKLNDIKVQQHIYLTAARIQYIADFSVFDKERKERVYWEAKGFETPEWRLKLRLYRYYGPAPLYVYRGPRATIEEVIPCPEDDV